MNTSNETIFAHETQQAKQDSQTLKIRQHCNNPVPSYLASDHSGVTIELGSAPEIPQKISMKSRGYALRRGVLFTSSGRKILVREPGTAKSLWKAGAVQCDGAVKYSCAVRYLTFNKKVTSMGLTPIRTTTDDVDPGRGAKEGVQCHECYGRRNVSRKSVFPVREM